MSLAQATKELAIKLFLERCQSPPPQLDNSLLQAGSPMVYYCRLCGHVSDIKPEEWLFDVRNRCSECEGLDAKGWLHEAQNQIAINQAGEWILRHYDGFDDEWIDITTPLPYAEAKARYDAETANGTKQTSYADIDYFKLFPAQTEMLRSAQGNADSEALALREGDNWHLRWDGIQEMVKRDGLETTIKVLNMALKLHTDVYNGLKGIGAQRLAEHRSHIVAEQTRFIRQLERERK